MSNGKTRKEHEQFHPNVRKELVAWALSPEKRSLNTSQWLKWAADLGLPPTLVIKKRMQDVVAFEVRKKTKISKTSKNKTIKIINNSKTISKNQETQAVTLSSQKCVQTSPLPSTSSNILSCPRIQSPTPSTSNYDEPYYTPLQLQVQNPPDNCTLNNIGLQNFNLSE